MKPKPQIKIDWATRDAAAYACKRWHYSKCMPTGKMVLVGVWEDDIYIGVVIFSRGASPFLMKKYDLVQADGCELTRVALNSHRTAVSRIVAIAIKFLSKKNPATKLIVSFADPAKGHHGGIYQAGNWIYSGTSSPTTEVYLKGRWRHMKACFYQMTDKTPTRTTPGKHRYLFPLDSEVAEKVKSLAKPYPKRVKQAMTGTPGTAAEQHRPTRSSPIEAA